MCHGYGTDENTWTRLCYRTGQPGARIPGDARGPNGHVPASRRKERSDPTPKHRRAREPVCALCGAPDEKLNEAGRCPICLLQIARGDRPDPDTQAANVVSSDAPLPASGPKNPHEPGRKGEELHDHKDDPPPRGRR